MRSEVWVEVFSLLQNAVIMVRDREVRASKRTIFTVCGEGPVGKGPTECLLDILLGLPSE